MWPRDAPTSRLEATFVGRVRLRCPSSSCVMMRDVRAMSGASAGQEPHFACRGGKLLRGPSAATVAWQRLCPCLFGSLPARAMLKACCSPRCCKKMSPMDTHEVARTKSIIRRATHHPTGNVRKSFATNPAAMRCHQSRSCAVSCQSVTAAMEASTCLCPGSSQRRLPKLPVPPPPPGRGVGVRALYIPKEPFQGPAPPHSSPFRNRHACACLGLGLQACQRSRPEPP